MSSATTETKTVRADVRLGYLREVACSDLIALHTDPRVVRHLPLAREGFDEEACRRWVAEKESQWEIHGYGPWAIFVEGAFAGWGGFQWEQGDADLALVLAPKYWGYGSAVSRKMIRIAFQELGLASITALLPPGRVRVKGMCRLGFQRDGQVQIADTVFHRYRLCAPFDEGSHRKGE